MMLTFFVCLNGWMVGNFRKCRAIANACFSMRLNHRVPIATGNNISVYSMAGETHIRGDPCVQKIATLESHAF